MTADRLIAGRYRLTDPIGTGAMGVVWRGTDVRLRRTVAVKQLILAPGLTRSAALEAKLRAMREGRIAARLHHPNAITVFDVAEEDGQPWLVMEYMNAPSLAAKLSGKRTLAPTEVAKIGAQAAGALAAAHDAGIMHRDVKPANLLVGDDGTVKITDFGISRAVGDVTVTATGFLAGTPAYLAPEVARGENPEPASDVFALGSTLYAAVEGQPPFGEGDNPLAVLHAVARGEIAEPKEAGALGPVLMRLLAPTIDARPSMHEAKQALEAVAEGRVPTLGPPPPTKAMPAPGGDSATTVLPQPAADAANATAATTVVPTAALTDPGVAESVSVQPPIPPSGSGTLPAGTGAVPSRNRAVLLGAGAFVAVLVVVGLVALLVKGNDGDSGTAAAPGPSSSVPALAGPPPATGDTGPVPQQPQEPAPSTEPAPTSSPGASTSPTPTPTPTPSSAPPTSSAPPAPTTVTATPFGPPTPDKVAQFVQGYYGMLPGNTAGAWSQLTPSYQVQTGGGYNEYARWWGTVRSVSVGRVTPNGDNRAVVALTYVMKTGETRSENRWIQVTADNGRMLISGSGT
ncbi:protein kinase [Nocardia brasiliensis]|uniref:non-specific serine/threonine protein kinase n=1 Tax=Nocardia brasiliensis TaxID=37326 RepID=A0A6G9XUJ1_NOCBR|nr:serine/threonine-protein kinase [Nocardia brasiliensis]QIS04622.1 protein kinase [Nocardia brasiliensis]